MKKISIGLIIFLFSTSVLFAQEQVQLLKFKGVKADIGFSWDRYRDMSLDWMQARTAQEGAFTDDLSGMQEGSAIYSSVGSSLGGQLLFTAPSLGTEVLIPEVRIGGAVLLGKEAIVDYWDRGTNSSNSLMYCFVENETRFSGEIVWRVLDESRVTFYGGLGANVSASFGNELYVFEDYVNNRVAASNDFQPMDFTSIQNTFDGKSVIYQRFYIPVGLDFKMLRHLQGTVEYKAGGGLEQVVGGDVSTFRTGEFLFGMRFNLERNNTPSILDLF